MLQNHASDPGYEYGNLRARCRFDHFKSLNRLVDFRLIRFSFSSPSTAQVSSSLGVTIYLHDSSYITCKWLPVRSVFGTFRDGAHSASVTRRDGSGGGGGAVGQIQPPPGGHVKVVVPRARLHVNKSTKTDRRLAAT